MEVTPACFVCKGKRDRENYYKDLSLPRQIKIKGILIYGPGL